LRHVVGLGVSYLLLEVMQDLFRCVFPGGAVTASRTVMAGAADVVRVLTAGMVEVTDQEYPAPAGMGLQVGKQLLLDAGLDFAVPAAFDLDDHGEGLGGGIAGVAGLDVDVSPGAVELLGLYLHLAVDHRFPLGKMFPQECAYEVGWLSSQVGHHPPVAASSMRLHMSIDQPWDHSACS